MKPEKRHALAQEFRVKPASIDQLLNQGIPETDALLLLSLRDDAQVSFDIHDKGVQDIKPSVRDMANTLLLFGDLDKVRATVDRFKHDMSTHTPDVIEGIAVPKSYRAAQATVTQGYQRALYSEIIANLSRAPAFTPLLIPMVLRSIHPHGETSAAHFLAKGAERMTEDRVKAEDLVDKTIDITLALPDQDIFLRTPQNDPIVLSKPDILLALAKYRPQDTEYIAEIRHAIDYNDDKTRAAIRKHQLYQVSQDKNDLRDAGLTALIQARELVRAPITKGAKRNDKKGYYAHDLFNVLHEFIKEHHEGSNYPDSPTVEVLRKLADRIGELRYGDLSRVVTAVAELTNAPKDIERLLTVDEDSYIWNFVRTGKQPLDPVLTRRLGAFDRELSEGMGGESGVQVVMDLVELVKLFDNEEAKDKVLALDLTRFDKSRQSRVYNALCEAFIKNGHYEEARQITEKMTNDQRRKEYLAKIALLESQ